MDINITDTINADQIEDGDQIAVNGDHLENVVIDGDPNDPDAVVITGWSVNTGDLETYSVRYDTDVDVWSI